jgi:hypothetical protein
VSVSRSLALGLAHSGFRVEMKSFFVLAARFLGVCGILPLEYVEYWSAPVRGCAWQAKPFVQPCHNRTDKWLDA